ncbi:hypothetical protein BRARA_E03603 [Brassica rapa]|uniref:Peptidase M16 C-terminal domain-containing protein n=1 Tax=Brassica campestris TaxID=3711 RepID=A0A397ZK10_BRACM|nr:hypothetical protein BRARA_E03603 [Brassica rapa]
MAMKNLLTSALRSQRRLALNRAARALSSVSALDSASLTSHSPSPTPPILMPYDHSAEIVKEKLKRLENPDQRFLKYASPHPILASHNHILSAPETRVTTLPNGLRNSKFEEQRINRERDVILREMQEVEGQTDEVVLDHLHATAFQYTPLGRTILGPAQNIKSITRKDLQNYIKTHYTASRMVIAAAGAVKHEEVVEQVKKLFNKLSSDPTTTTQLVAKEPASFTGSEVRMIDDDLPLAQFAVAFEGASWTDPDSVALMVMQTMLGSWNKNVGGGKHMGSALTQRVAVNEIAESIMAFNTNYKDTGLFGVYAVAKADCLDDLSYAIMHEVTKLAFRVSDDDVTRARNQLKSSLLLHMDGTSPVAEDIGRQLLTYGRRIPTAELFARIDAVDASTVKRVANKYIYDKDIAISAIGPIQDLPDYNKFRRGTYWNRY